MIPDLIVKINSADEAIGTGYPIAEGVILTAWHVVNDLSAKDIQLEWPSLQKNEDGACTVTADEVVYEECWKDYDIALLYCKFPNQVQPLFQPVEPLLSIPSHDGARWLSVGFPALNEFAEKDTSGLIGVDLNRHQIRLVLDTTYSDEAGIPDHLESGWAAMSGAPVFCGRSRKLFGVIVDHEKWMDKEIYAVSLPYLVKEDASFAQLSGFHKDSSEHQKTFSDLCLEFTSSIAGTELSKVVAAGLIDASLEATPENIVEAIAEKLTEDPIGLLETLRLIIEPEIKRDADAIDHAKQFFCLVLGMYAARNISPDSGYLHLLSVRTRAAVEINLAAQYQLPPDLERKTGEGIDIKDSMAGRYAIDDDFIPEVGWDKSDNADAITEVVNIAVNKAHKTLFGENPQAALDEFEREELNETLVTRRKGSAPQLIRFDIHAHGKAGDSHPLMNDEVCATLQGPDYLPDLPVVRFGLGAAENEAKLRTQINEFFRVIEENTQ